MKKIIEFFKRNFISAFVLILSLLVVETSALAEEPRKLPPLRPKAYRNLDLAQQHIDAKNWQAAGKELNVLKLGEARLNNHEKALMYNLMGFIAFSNNDLNSAIDSYLEVIRDPKAISKPMEESTLFGLSQLYFGLDNFNKSVEFINRWESLSGKKNVQAKLLKAQSFYQLKQYDKGIKPLESAISINNEKEEKPPQENWLLLLRILYFESGKKELALNAMKRLTKHYPKPEYFLQMATLHGQLGNEKEQMALLEGLEESDQLTEQTDLLNLANLYLAQETPINTVNLLNKHLKNKTISEELKTIRLLGSAQALAKEFADASITFERLYKLENDSSHLLESARMAWMDEDYDRVRNLLSGSIDNFKEEDKGESHLLNGMALFYLKEFNDARTTFEKAKDFKGLNSRARQWISLVNSEQKRQESIEKYI